jgi:hypothetical protein
VADTQIWHPNLASCGRVVLVEVKKTQAKTGLTIVEDFPEKVEVYGKQFPEQKILPAFLGGFTGDAQMSSAWDWMAINRLLRTQQCH